MERLEYAVISEMSDTSEREEILKVLSDNASLKEALAELQEKYDALEDGANFAYSEYKEYQRLEKQGLLIKLCCKVGDNVVVSFDLYGEIFNQIGWKVNKMEFVDGDIVCEFHCMATDEYERRSISDFGKTVFFTQTEAEEALQKGSVSHE